MTTSTNKITLAELEKSTHESSISKALYVVRRWPIIPFIILGVLILCALFSPWLAPYEPEKDQLRAVLAMPAWAEACGKVKYPINSNHVIQMGLDLGKMKRSTISSLGQTNWVVTY